ncbi:uncharacterized protein adm2b isoform X2 [Cynoglossus semilaevis]|uniref:uncharacterized protein adm2b isoform X2 n=1 Tax=Cynoglossus semilaevis TaxID=244447 RepID=UPI000D62D7F5|nr:ADM2 isoform X2 [Cynoglossus semilaevis]
MLNKMNCHCDFGLFLTGPSVTRTSKYPKSSPDTIVMPTVSNPSINHHIKQRRFLWRALMRKETGPTFPALLLDPSSHLLQKTAVPLRRSRGRRHASVGRGHGHLMRAGCILGTCQVQNLSHRLYQLIGQSGRENSSPVNPYSPHSYG